MDPGDLHLPAVFDPLFTYLADTLPPPLYNFLINFLSHCLALLSSLLNLVIALLSRSPAEWNAQTVLPPLISLLAAYLALVSIYRTTSWLIRTSIWFAKWGILFGALTAGIGWYIGTTQTGGIVASGFTSHIANLLSDMIINGQNRAAVPSKQDGYVGGSRSSSKSAERPKAWESFDRHREWQYNADHNDEAEQSSDLEKLFNSLMDVTGQILEGPWWSRLKDMMDGADGHPINEKGRTRDRTNTESRSTCKPVSTPFANREKLSYIPEETCNN